MHQACSYWRSASADACRHLTELAVARAVARLDGTVVGEREHWSCRRRLVVRGTTAPPRA